MANIARLRDAEISNGNLIDADDISAELDQLVSSFNANDTLLTNIASGAVTLAGVKTFSSSPKTNGIDERGADAGVTVDGVLCKDGNLKLGAAGYTPATDGEFGYDSTAGLFKGHANGAAFSLGGVVNAISAKAADFTAVATDIGKSFWCTNTIAATLTAAATLGVWSAWFFNGGTGVVTLTPSGADTIQSGPNFRSTLKLWPGEHVFIYSDGVSKFLAVGLGDRTVLATTAVATAASVNLIGWADEFENIIIEGRGLAMTADLDLSGKISVDGGANWRATAGDYQYSVGYLFNTGETTQNTLSSTSFVISRTGSENMNIGDLVDFDLKLLSPYGNQAKKKIELKGDYVRGAADMNVSFFGFANYKGSTAAVNGLQVNASTSSIASGTMKVIGERRR